MKREGTIGAATLLAIAAVVGFSVQTGPKPAEGGRVAMTTPTKRSKPSIANAGTEEGPGCGSLRAELEDFLETKLVPPKSCYPHGKAPEHQVLPELIQKTSQLKFIVATLPDPIHTHSPVLFDQFAVAIQEAAQDENYDFDSSWLPWDDAESSYALLEDEKISNRERELKEDQPGIILFRKAEDCTKATEHRNNCNEDPGAPMKKGENRLTEGYREGLVVFVVGEESTQGIHRAQFRNALAWISALQPRTDAIAERFAILGPTFSGSLPSVAQVLSENEIAKQLDMGQRRKAHRLAIYSGSVSSGQSAQDFHDAFDPHVVFHSFVQKDDEILDRFCKYIMKEQPQFDAGRVAIISEDETAFGRKIGGPADEPGEANYCRDKALNLYYPRDIAALRGAYQTTSLFDAGSQPTDAQKKNLPSDLADPAGKVHDSIRSYGGPQTPLNQEAFLLEIVAALQELHARYILLRSSNTLDQLFLTNFLHRNYPDGRIVILGSDLMFIRERGATGLNGVMTLSTYPLFPLERDWTEHQSLPATDRAFSADTGEGTYVALRLLLNDPSLNGGQPTSDRCHVLDDREKDKDQGKMPADTIFLPPVSCANKPPIPDYSPPFWTLPDECGEFADKNSQEIANKGDTCLYPGPATWLSVIGVNRYWPMASLTDPPPRERSVDQSGTERGVDRDADPLGRPEMPVGMKVGWVVLIAFALFHAWCCWAGSYTGKPAFRAHFASTGDWRHTALVFGGSCCVAFLSVVTGWGCGLFSRPADGLVYCWFAFGSLAVVCLLAWLAILGNSKTSWKLSKDRSRDPSSLAHAPTVTDLDYTMWNYGATGLFLAAMTLFVCGFVTPIENALLRENRVLTYWRAMHLTSGVSPIVPILLFIIGLYLSFWLAFHGLALFGADRPRLPLRQTLALRVDAGQEKYFLRMFSQEDAAVRIEKAAMPLTGKAGAISAVLFVLFLAVALGIGRGVPVRSLGAESYAIIFLACLSVCCSLALAETWRFYDVWGELRRLLAFLDRVPLRRALSAMRGFSWGNVWKMSANVLDVRYKVISRQIECMNHTIESLNEYVKSTWDHPGAQESLEVLKDMRAAGLQFATWYSKNYAEVHVGDLTRFREFQKSIADASGILFAKLLVPAWRKETESLLALPARGEKEESAPNPPAQAKEAHIRNAEEFVCLNYLSFVQNVLGRLRTMAITIVVLFLAATIATSTYPFDPRQGLSAVLIVLFVIAGVVIVKVYAEMHRDATLSHVTNTTPGELGAEFWFKVVAFGFAPFVTLMTRVFPGIADFVFSWLQPGVAALK